MVSRLSCSFSNRIHAEPPQKTLGEPQITTLHNHPIACTSAKSRSQSARLRHRQCTPQCASHQPHITSPSTLHLAMCQSPPAHCASSSLCASHHPHIGAKPEAQHTTSPANKPNPKPNKPPDAPMCQPPLAHCAAARQPPRLPSKTAGSVNRQVQPTGRFN